MTSGAKAYLDNSATTKPCPQAVAAMVRALEEQYYNPSALYTPAMNAEQELEKVRRILGDSVGADSKDVIFTSGGTESNNLAIIGHMIGQRRDGVILYSAAEHPSVKNACLEAAALHGQLAREIPLTMMGTLDLLALEGMLDPRVRLICVMQVCNETGTVMPLGRVAALRDKLAPQAAIHVDGVQGYLRIPFSMEESGVESYAVSGHKVFGPKGVGALMLRRGHRIRPILVGGGQERNLRSGTENTAGIAGFGAATENYPHFSLVDTHARALKVWMAQQLKSAIPEAEVLGMAPEEPAGAGHILLMTFPPVRAETMVHALEADGVLVGTGSACSSKKGKRSTVLTAMGISPEMIDSAIRISFSPGSTREEAAQAVESIVKHFGVLRKFKRR